MIKFFLPLTLIVLFYLNRKHTECRSILSESNITADPFDKSSLNVDKGYDFVSNEIRDSISGSHYNNPSQNNEEINISDRITNLQGNIGFGRSSLDFRPRMPTSVTNAADLLNPGINNMLPSPITNVADLLRPRINNMSPSSITNVADLLRQPVLPTSIRSGMLIIISNNNNNVNIYEEKYDLQELLDLTYKGGNNRLYKKDFLDYHNKKKSVYLNANNLDKDYKLYKNKLLPTKSVSIDTTDKGKENEKIKYQKKHMKNYENHTLKYSEMPGNNNQIKEDSIDMLHGNKDSNSNNQDLFRFGENNYDKNSYKNKDDYNSNDSYNKKYDDDDDDSYDDELAYTYFPHPLGGIIIINNKSKNINEDIRKILSNSVNIRNQNKGVRLPIEYLTDFEITLLLRNAVVINNDNNNNNVD